MNKLEKIFSQNPKSPIFTILASIYYNQRSYKNAAEVCKIGLKYDPQNIPGQYMLAKLLLLKNDIHNAEKVLKNIILVEPQHLNGLLLLIAVIERLDKSIKSVIPYIRKSAQLYPSNTAIQDYYMKYCTQPHRTKKQSANQIKTKQQKAEFILNSKLATKTLYQLFYSQKKYFDAHNVLITMRHHKANKAFVLKEMKKIKNKISKG